MKRDPAWCRVSFLIALSEQCLQVVVSLDCKTYISKSAFLIDDRGIDMDHYPVHACIETDFCNVGDIISVYPSRL